MQSMFLSSKPCSALGRSIEKEHFQNSSKGPKEQTNNLGSSLGRKTTDSELVKYTVTLLGKSRSLKVLFRRTGGNMTVSREEAYLISGLNNYEDGRGAGGELIGDGVY